jgi:4,5-DOPA dioxygenase extradiol
VLVISAHWETEGSVIASTDQPVKLDDFFGNHPELKELTYHAPGAPEQAVALNALIADSRFDDTRGLDHGAWAILVHLFPDADVPVFQMSLDRKRSLPDAFVLGKRLRPLREQGVLIVGSGNICHNTQKINFNQHADPLPWNVEFDRRVADAIERSDLDSLMYPLKLAPAAAPEAVPTIEHYAPFLYALGATTPEDETETIYTGFEHAAISLRSYAWSEK